MASFAKPSFAFGSSMNENYAQEIEDDMDALNDQTFGDDIDLGDWEKEHEKLSFLESGCLNKENEETSVPCQPNNQERTSLNYFSNDLLRLNSTEKKSGVQDIQDPAILGLIPSEKIPQFPNAPSNSSFMYPGLINDPKSIWSPQISFYKTELIDNTNKNPVMRLDELEASFLKEEERKLQAKKEDFKSEHLNTIPMIKNENNGWGPFTNTNLVQGLSCKEDNIKSDNVPVNIWDKHINPSNVKTLEELEREMMSERPKILSVDELEKQLFNETNEECKTLEKSKLHKSLENDSNLKEKHEQGHQILMDSMTPQNLIPSQLSMNARPMIPAPGSVQGGLFPRIIPSSIPQRMPLTNKTNNPMEISFPPNYYVNMRHPQSMNTRISHPNYFFPLIRNINHSLVNRPPFLNYRLSHPFLAQQQQMVLKMHQNQHRNHNYYYKSKYADLCTDGEFCCSLTQKEKDWLIKIQLLQLEFDDPYKEDYYYVTLTSRKLAAQNLNKTKSKEPNRDENSTSLIIPERVKNNSENERKDKNYTPRQFEGSLGKISVANVNCPRKLLDFSKTDPDTDLVPNTIQGQNELKKFRKLLLEIERLYVIVLNIDDEDKRMGALPIDSREPHILKRRELCDKLFHGITDETNKKISKRIAGIRKGSMLIFRSLQLASEPLHKATIIKDLLDINNFHLVITQKDQTVYGFDYGQILIDCIKTIKDTSFSHLLNIADGLNDPATAAKYQCGEEIIMAIINQYYEFKSLTIEDEKKWYSFVKRVFEEIEDIQNLRKFCLQHLNKVQ